MVTEGDIVEIPLPDGRSAIGWILHMSKHFKDAVGLIVFGLKGQPGIGVNYDPETDAPLSMKVLGPLYTHVEAIQYYRWTRIGHQPISESKRLMTKRRVADGVYVGDEYIGSVEEVGEPNLPVMRAYGMIALYGEIETAFGQSVV